MSRKFLAILFKIEDSRTRREQLQRNSKGKMLPDQSEVVYRLLSSLIFEKWFKSSLGMPLLLSFW